MNFLAIECSTDTLSLAASNAKDTWYFETAGGALTSRILVPECLNGLAQLGLRMQDLDAIVYGRGPGSFTGLRTACSVAQGFSYPHATPCFGVDSLLAMAQTALSTQQETRRVFSVIDARMGQLYVGAYERFSAHWQVHQEPTLVDPSETQVPATWSSGLKGEPFLLVTNTQGGLHEDLLNALRAQSPNHQTLITTPRADALIALAHAQFSAQGSGPSPLGTLGLPAPLYIRDRVAQTTLERNLKHQAANPPPP